MTLSIFFCVVFVFSTPLKNKKGGVARSKPLKSEDKNAGIVTCRSSSWFSQFSQRIFGSIRKELFLLYLIEFAKLEQALA